MNNIGEEVKVYWVADDEWYPGIIDEYHRSKGYHVQYFDGEDEWLPTSAVDDGKLRFENGTKLSKTVTFGSTFASENELKVLSRDQVTPKITSPNDYQISESEDEDKQFHSSSMNNTKKSYEYDNIQTISNDGEEIRQAIMSELHRLDLTDRSGTGNNNTVILAGCISGAYNLPQLNSGDSSKSEVTYRVLFMEGGSQPASFKCKTPIFSSEDASNKNPIDPIWNYPPFKFEMKMPVMNDTADDEEQYRYEVDKSSHFIQGEILIAIYRSRANGGNDMIGQVSFDLQEICHSGSIEYFQVGCEARGLSGQYELISRSDNVVGTIEVELCIAWKGVPKRNESSGLMNRAQSNLVNNNRNNTSSKVLLTKSSQNLVSDNVSKLNPKSRKSVIKPTNPNQPRTIISNNAKRQREEAKRIEQQNKILQEKLMKKGGAATASKITELGYGGILKSGGVASSEIQKKSEHEVRDKRLILANNGDAKDLNSKSDQQQYESLLNLLNQIKKNNANDENEQKNMRAKINHLKVNIQKYEVIIDKIKTKNKSSKETNVLKSENSVSSRGTDVPKNFPGKSNKSTNYESFDDPVDEKVIVDNELQSIRDEYDVLQRVRRGIIERIKTAKETVNKHQSNQISGLDQTELFLTRLQYYPLLDNYSSKYDLNSIISRYYSTQTNPNNNNNNNNNITFSNTNDEDFILFEKLYAMNAEVSHYTDWLDNNYHTLPLNNTIDSLNEVIDRLEKFSDNLTNEIEEIMQNKEIIQQKLSELIQTNKLHYLHNDNDNIYANYLRINRQKRINEIEEEYNTIELELLRLKLKSKEKEEKKGIIF
eukprot:gene9732-13097_t